MKQRLIKILSLSFIVFQTMHFDCLSQSEAQLKVTIDSLRKVINSAKHDTLIVKAWIEWDNLIYYTDPSLDLELNKKIDSLSTLKLKTKLNTKEKKLYYYAKGFALNSLGLIEQSTGNYKLAIKHFKNAYQYRKLVGDNSGMTGCLGNIGNTYNLIGDYQTSLKYNLRCLKEYKKIGNHNEAATTLTNIGNAYKEMGNHSKGIANYMEALKLYEIAKNQNGIAAAYNNIGILYVELGNTEKAEEFFKKSHQIKKKTGDVNGIATALMNIGIIYKTKNKYNIALKYYLEGLEIAKELNNQQYIAFTGNNISNIYVNQADSSQKAGNISYAKQLFSKAIEHQSKSIDILEKMGEKSSLASNYNNMGLIYYTMGDMQKAKHFSLKAYQMATETKYLHEIKESTNALYKIYKNLRDYQAAMNMFEQFVLFRDSINNETNHKELIRQEFKYQYEKQSAADSVANAKQQDIKNAEIAKHKAEINAKRNQQYLLFGGLGLVLIFAFIMYNRFKVTNKQKKEIEKQKALVEEKQKEILDSIHYAKRIQMALLPSDKYIERKLGKK